MIDEKDRLTDSLITQKHIASGYNTAAIESSNSQLKETFMNILRDEHQIQYEIYQEMNNRGWYQPKAANVNDISQNVNKWNQELQRVQSAAARQPGAAHQAGFQAGYQSGFYAGAPQYGMQTGTGIPPTGQETHQYRHP
ncbi:MAG TPA: spore coat protein [Bacillota bacterium]|nr:spore coat protein [Bacillota bacterium]